MENIIYTSIGPVLHLNKAGELAQKRMKAAKLCDGLYITEPDKSGYTQFICELNGVVWLDCKAAENRIADGIKLMPGYFDKIKAGCFDGENFPEFKREISRRINHPDSPAIMELKKPERKKTAPLPEGAKKASVLMFKGSTDEIIDKKVIINEVAPHVYTYTYKLKGYGERVKIIFEIDSVYFQGADNGSYVMAREDFNEICAKAYEHARENVADGAAKGMQYFVEVQKRIDAATSTETVRIVRVEIVRDFDKSYYANLYDENGGGYNLSKEYTDFRTLTSLCKKEYGVNLPNLSQMEFETHGRKSYAYISTETPQNSTETAELSIAPICELYNNPDIEPELDAGLYYEWLKRAEKGSYKTIAEKAMTEVWINIFLAAYKRGKGHVLAMNERRELVDTVFVLNNAPQPPETPQAVKHTTYVYKPRETVRKLPNSAIRNCRTTHVRQKLGVQGYSMLADASATLAAINVPPIRGDCKISISTRAKPPNCASREKINILQPP